jgi:hypothetical protein
MKHLTKSLAMSFSLLAKAPMKTFATRMIHTMLKSFDALHHGLRVSLTLSAWVLNPQENKQQHGGGNPVDP